MRHFQQIWVGYYRDEQIHALKFIPIHPTGKVANCLCLIGFAPWSPSSGSRQGDYSDDVIATIRNVALSEGMSPQGFYSLISLYLALKNLLTTFPFIVSQDSKFPSTENPRAIECSVFCLFNFNDY